MQMQLERFYEFDLYFKDNKITRRDDNLAFAEYSGVTLVYRRTVRHFVLFFWLASNSTS